eukprot:2458108-Rhodomonas_salina.2
MHWQSDSESGSDSEPDSEPPRQADSESLRRAGHSGPQAQAEARARADHNRPGTPGRGPPAVGPGP